MSIASEITRLQSAKAAIKTAIEGKGVSVPSATKLDGYPTLIDSIQTGGGGTNVEDELITRTLSGAYTNSRVTVIGSYAFAYCSALTAASFPAATTIGASAFHNCRALTAASFPVCFYVSDYAFRSCTALKTVSFPALRSNSGFSWGTFQSCYSLESVYLLGSVVGKATRSDVFASTPLSLSSYLGYFGSIYVRQSLLASWQTATVWTLYSSRFVGLTDAEIEALG